MLNEEAINQRVAQQSRDNVRKKNAITFSRWAFPNYVDEWKKINFNIKSERKSVELVFKYRSK